MEKEPQEDIVVQTIDVAIGLIAQRLDEHTLVSRSSMEDAIDELLDLRNTALDLTPRGVYEEIEGME